MNPIEIIKKHYTENSPLYNILIDHSTDVTRKALQIAENHPELNIDKQFVSEAGMLHDIGIFMTYAPSIECYGEHPYMAHGYLGSELLQKEEFPRHALVCERHTGAGLKLAEIIEQDLPLPHREMMPISIEEQVICFADCFFSKTHLGMERDVSKVRKKLEKFGERSVYQFDTWCNIFL
ncbi:MAG: HDIG domain-containing protein [Dysgonomonas sp.]|nr:HDIG domain-containing protein [Dysgonomonas sp.]